VKRILFIACLLLVCVSVSYFILNPKKQKPLPIINPKDLNEEMVDPELLRIGQGHQIGDFKFQNQNKKTITQKEINGKVFVAEYFFTNLSKYLPLNEQANAANTTEIQGQ
jgi:hypothetical protein